MNPLETLKVKPAVLQHTPVIVKIKHAQELQPKGPATVIIDKRVQGYDPKAFLERMQKTELSTIIPNNAIANELVVKSQSPIEINPIKKKSSKKLKNAQFVILDENEPAEPKKRKTEKVVKGVVELGTENMIEFGETALKKRLPLKADKIDLRVSSYFMNNREIFVNFINGLFEPYKDNLLDESKGITCKNMGQNPNNPNQTDLLTHQKLVRDYINLYTPYRGLLLYHGLGSGKTNSSIAIAEGLKSSQKIIVMTPASLRRNYLEEIKKYGDLIYRKNQFWEWISIVENPNSLDTLSSVLSLPIEYIRRKHGAWLVNVTQPSNYNDLSSTDKKSLDEQLDEMIQNKYTFINYNGLRRDKFKQLTNNFEQNIFDNAVVIIDEAHNLISRIVNKINKLKTFDKGPGARMHTSLWLQIYEFLLRANNSRIVLLTGTPIINYPNEIGILFNILRGYIKTWHFTLNVETTDKLSKETLLNIFSREKVLDYVDYNASSKTLTITRNPYGFDSKITEKSGYKGVKTDVEDQKTVISDDEFIKRIVKILKKNNIVAITKGTQFVANTALPDTLDEFINLFVDKETGNVHNMEKFKKRIIGLTSYFKSAQEELLPRYNKITDFHVIKLPMSNYQFKIYEDSRVEERKMEKSSKNVGGRKLDANGMFIEPKSTYRIFSRLFCNFVMPRPPGRPVPMQFFKQSKQKNDKSNKEGEVKEPDSDSDSDADAGVDVETKLELEKLDDPVKITEYKNDDSQNRDVSELEGDEILEVSGDQAYKNKIKEALQYLKTNASQFLTADALETYSPKFLAMLENIQDPDHLGLHLVYSQFRSMEGIAILCLVLEANGFAQFKIKKVSDGWILDMKDDDVGKPTFALYTGTEDAEEREIIRNVYNGTWEYIPTQLSAELSKISNNNNMGEIIKVLMITAAGSEGINLRNTRYVHLMEPYWHPVRLEQVVGRARRICSHQDLPIELQTVEVFLYLMTFTPDQLKSDEAIELKLHDLSKRAPFIPLTSDEKLFEISNIKEDISAKLLKGIKESSIDCAVHVKTSSKEGLTCLSFGQPSPNSFSYNPNYSQDENDNVAVLNKVTITWEGREFKFNGKQMILREETKEVYDYESYQEALKTPGVKPILLGKLEKKDNKYRIVKS